MGSTSHDGGGYRDRMQLEMLGPTDNDVSLDGYCQYRGVLCVRIS